LVFEQTVIWLTANILKEESIELEGLHASLDKLVHHREKSKVEGIDLHAFIYFISISNLSDRSVTLLGRKWVLANDDGTKTVVEGEKIVGESPIIPPGEISRIIAIMLPIFQQKRLVLFMVWMNSRTVFISI
jgi:hypothetical protein